MATARIDLIVASGLKKKMPRLPWYQLRPTSPGDLPREAP
jgi:hypothetical protein